MSAGENLGKSHLVLTNDSCRLIVAHEDEITLCPLNSGNTTPFAHKRGTRALGTIRSPNGFCAASITRLLRSRSNPAPRILDFVVTADYMTFAGGSIRRLQNISRRAGGDDCQLRSSGVGAQTLHLSP